MHTIIEFLSTRSRYDRIHANLLDHLYTERWMILRNPKELNHYEWEPMSLLNPQVQL